MNTPVPDHELPGSEALPAAEWLQREQEELAERLARHDHSYLWVDAVLIGGLAGIVIALVVVFGA